MRKRFWEEFQKAFEFTLLEHREVDGKPPMAAAMSIVFTSLVLMVHLILFFFRS
jgi:hypothetical protein